jgi:hypothetical protein
MEIRREKEEQEGSTDFYSIKKAKEPIGSSGSFAYLL